VPGFFWQATELFRAGVISLAAVCLVYIRAPGVTRRWQQTEAILSTAINLSPNDRWIWPGSMPGLFFWRSGKATGKRLAKPLDFACNWLKSLSTSAVDSFFQSV
jgi:hypothetical protein